MAHLLGNDLISNRQYGFVKADLHHYNYYKYYINGQIAWKMEAKLMLFTYFEKAFDEVPHNRLILKLSSYGNSNTIIKQIQNFLTARKFRVRVNLSHSAWSDVTGGIPCCLLTTQQNVAYYTQISTYLPMILSCSDILHKTVTKLHYKKV